MATSGERLMALETKMTNIECKINAIDTKLDKFAETKADRDEVKTLRGWVITAVIGFIGILLSIIGFLLKPHFLK